MLTHFANRKNMRGIPSRDLLTLNRVSAGVWCGMCACTVPSPGRNNLGASDNPKAPLPA